VGRALPKGSWLPVPLFVDVWVGDAIHWTGDRDSYMVELRLAIANLARRGRAAQWSELK
jgi:1-acyl-sn-glycerol-3-phosphate acyltransferase